MRIAICGADSHKESAIIKAQNALKVEVKKPMFVSNETILIDHAAETYKYFGEHDVIFDGSPFDYLGQYEAEGYNDVYEQIALNSLVNLDYVVVIAMDMDRKTLKLYNDYAKLYPEKFYIYSSDTEFEIVMK